MASGENCYRRFLNGEAEAFDELVDLYRDGLIFFINGFLHNIHDAEDIAADTFLELIVHKKRYNFDYSLKSYIYMMARCRALNFLKRSRRIAADDIYENESLLKDEAELADQIITSERNKRLYDAMGSIAEDYRTVLHLIYFENMTYEQAAEVMKKNVKQINNLAYRAKNALRAILVTEDFSYEA